MTKLKRKDFVAQSFRFFVASACAAAATLIGGGGYLILNKNCENILTTAFKIGGIEITLLAVTYISWRTYTSDKKLLKSSTNEYINTTPSNADPQGTSLPDIDIDC